MKTLTHPHEQNDTAPASAVLDVEKVREDFPILRRRIRGKPLIYLDNAATTQKPNAVIDAVAAYYRLENANIHRGVHYLSEVATGKFEATRELARKFINAASTTEIIFTSGTTESINLVAASFASAHLRAGDEVIISALEHHSNIVPWQLLRDRLGIQLTVAPVTDNGEFLFDAYMDMISERTRLVAITHVSNALGVITPIKRIIDLAHEFGAVVLVDGAQAAPHMAIDVRSLDCDFYTFSGHKLFGPTGIGILYGREALLEQMPPYKGGGDMIRSVTFEKTTYNSLPYKFEAGTPNIAGVVGLGVAIEYVSAIGPEQIAAYERGLLDHAVRKLSEIDGVRLLGLTDDKAAVLSFVVNDIHPHDIGTLLDRRGIAVRTGHHCAQPLMERLGVTATTRASFSVYNTASEIDHLAEALPEAVKMFK